MVAKKFDFGEKHNKNTTKGAKVFCERKSIPADIALIPSYATVSEKKLAPIPSSTAHQRAIYMYLIH
jgi:hypothetical protein